MSFQTELEEIKQALEKIRQAFLGLPSGMKDMDDIYQHFPEDILELVRKVYPSDSDQESLHLALQASTVAASFRFASLPPEGNA